MDEKLKETTQLTNDTESESADSIKAIRLTKKPVVVLTKLPEYKISALRPPTPEQFYSEDESLSSSDSEIEWEPLPLKRPLSNKKINEKIRKRIKISNTSCSSNNTLASDPVIITSPQQLSQCNNDSTKVRPKLPEQEDTVAMMVIARKRTLRWERGKIVETVTKDDGTIKYKVTFEDKGTMLVSGHHIAFDGTPTVAQLAIGSRVLSKCNPDLSYFSPGILGELPSRQNHMRFLVFFDDHTSLYVLLPHLRVTCKPLANSLDDIRDEVHKTFIQEYLELLPNPRQTQFRVGQKLRVKLNGVLEPCCVLQVDSSLIEVVFLKDQRKEWIYRGSFRLEHIINMKLLPIGPSWIHSP